MRSRARLSHPAVTLLAQMASSDLSWFQALTVKRHLRSCGGCQEYLDGVRAAQAELRRQAETETLTGFEAIADLGSLEHEMLGNISVGLAAARCVEQTVTRKSWKRTLAWAAGVGTLFVAGWWTHIPTDETRQVVSTLQSWARGEGLHVANGSNTLLRATPDGLSVRSQGSVLTMHHPRSATISAVGGGGMEARFVDNETGQVTISGVYGQ